MQTLRYILLALTLCALLLILGIAKVEASAWDWPGPLFLFGAAGALLANFVYLLEHVPKNSARFGLGRIGALVRLWLDAKEQELKSRSTQAR